MVDEKNYPKSVNDLGIAAFLLMHGHTVIGKHGKVIYFECHSENESADFDQLVLEYQPPNPFYTFDSCLMFLKKINEVSPGVINDDIHKCVSDLGVAAYLLMHEYKPKPMGIKLIGKRGKHVYFEHPKGCGEEFKKLCYEYLPSQFQTYDANLMALKKLGEYMPG